MSDRLYQEKHTRSAVEDVSEEARKLEQVMQLKTDMRNDTVERPPTRLERKFMRIFGSASQTRTPFK